MLRNYIASAVGNLSRNWLYAGITILGLAAGFAAAILIGLYVRDELSYERFIPGYQQVYRVQLDLALPGREIQRRDDAQASVARNFALDFPEVQAIARLEPFQQGLGRDRPQAIDTVGWADPDFFKVMPFPVLAGDPVAALQRPDGVVLTRSMARKYFGEDAPIGKTLMISPALDIGRFGLGVKEPHPVRVLAVLKDIPSATHLNLQVFASSRAPWAAMADQDAHPSPFDTGFYTYVRLKPGASAERISARLPAFDQRRYPPVVKGGARLSYRLVALKDLHFAARTSNDWLRQPGSRAVDAGIAAVGGLIVLIAAINFVTLMTARATRRAVEVGVRKSVGASRRDLVLQFMGEALVHVLIALLIAVAVVDLTLPSVNAFLDRTIVFDYLSDPALPAAMIGAALATALLAGFYPALVLSGFRTAQALKGGVGQAAGAAGVRQVLVVAQFAILISLIIVTATIYRQTSLAMQDALRLNADQVVRIRAVCWPNFRQELAAAPGVKATSCGSDAVEGQGGSTTVIRLPSGGSLTMQGARVGVGFFEMHGLKPVAGRLFAREHGEDVQLEQQVNDPNLQPPVIVNESAARVLGYRTAGQAVGQPVTWTRWSAMRGPGGPPSHSSQIVGVVRDFTLGSIRTPILPTLYYVDVCCAEYTLVQLDGRRLPEALPAIDRAWKRMGHDRPIQRTFESQGVQALYRDVYTQEAAIAVCSGLAIVIACLGLFALAAFTTERRIKEIGVRKAMGASTADVMRLLLWQFTQPVLWANLVAWPLAFWAMDQWLHGFAYRVDLPPWLFLAASLAAVLIAWATVSTHAWLVARSRPATALRYE
jgi:putative ABC transport system permease protein